MMYSTGNQSNDTTESKKKDFCNDALMLLLKGVYSWNKMQ